MRAGHQDLERGQQAPRERPAVRHAGHRLISTPAVEPLVSAGAARVRVDALSRVAAALRDGLLGALLGEVAAEAVPVHSRRRAAVRGAAFAAERQCATVRSSLRRGG